jgi:polyhydroxybutyrate depolymerase
MQNAVSFCVNGAGLPGKSDAEGFILIMPLGHQNSWNGGDCCGGAQTMGLDDVALIRAIFEEVAGHLNVDRHRVYTTGFSNGAYLSYRLACEAADLFVAAAPGAGGAPTPCNPSKPVSILDIHGTADGYVNYSLQKPSLDSLAAKNGCQLATSASSLPPSGGDTTCVTYGGCPAGVEVTGCTIQGGGHVWFGDPGCGTGVGPIGCVFVGANSDFMLNTDSIWKFFSRLSR